MKKYLFFKKKNKSNFYKIFIKLNFNSIVKPYKIPSKSTFFLLQTHIKDLNFYKKKKILIKQSYLMMTWFFFLKKNLEEIKNSRIFFFVKPKRKSKFTIIKSPMAHKTFSQEQYSVSFYSINSSIEILTKRKNFNYSTSLVSLLKIRNSMFTSGTNLFFLQKISIRLFSCDTKYFNLNFF